jgi:hypothetical protein
MAGWQDGRMAGWEDGRMGGAIRVMRELHQAADAPPVSKIAG